MYQGGVHKYIWMFGQESIGYVYLASGNNCETGSAPPRLSTYPDTTYIKYMYIPITL